MSKRIATTVCLSLGVWLAQSVQLVEAQQTGPVREGLRRTGEAAAQSTRAIAEGAGRALQRTGEVARDATRAARDATGRPLSGQDQGRYESGYRGVGDQAVQQGEFYGQPGYGQPGYGQPGYDHHVYDQYGQPIQHAQHFGYHEHHSGYRQSGNHHGPVYTLYHDAYGREFICVHGRRVYFDDHQQGQAQRGQAMAPRDADAPPGDYAPPELAQDEQDQFGREGQTRQEYQAGRPILDDQGRPLEGQQQFDPADGSPPAPPQDAETEGTTFDESARGEVDEEQGRAEVDADQQSTLRTDEDAEVEADAEAEADSDSRSAESDEEGTTQSEDDAEE